MTVRWKPLLVLSGLFAAIAILGFAAIAWTLIPRRAGDVLPLARAERNAGQFDKALIHYKQALQMDGKNPKVHEELASMFGEWAKKAPAEKKAEILAWRRNSLADAANFGKTLREPRKALLDLALEADDPAETVLWAKSVLTLEPNDATAHYALAAEALDQRTGDISEAKRHLPALEAAKAAPVRVAAIRASIAKATKDTATLEKALSSARTIKLPADADPVDMSALVRLRALDVETTTDPTVLEDRVKALQADVQGLTNSPRVSANRIMRISLVLEQVQKALNAAALKADPASREEFARLVNSIDGDVEAVFQKSLKAANQTDLHVYLVYADHLRFRGKTRPCLEVVAEGLKSPLASRAASNEVVMGLHAVAVEAVLADTSDPTRIDKAEPHIKDLIASSSPRFQGLGHLFQGAIELEQSGVGMNNPGARAATPAQAAAQPKLRTSALNHLKLAATQLPEVVEAQARYGVALILAQEIGLGRQYLQNAMRLGNAEPQYQVWAAWSMVQAGYPEEAEPIVKQLMTELSQGRVPKDLEGTLHLIAGEIHQARRSPADLNEALAEYNRSYDGKEAPAAVQLRMAQIEVELGKPEQALSRIEKLRASGQGGSSAEHLSVMTLIREKKDKEAFETLTAARKRMPESEELVGLEAALLSRDGKPKDADRVLADFIARNPGNTAVVLMRAQVLSDLLNDDQGARKLLLEVAETSDNSAPFVQLALLDLKRKDFEATAATINKIRGRWKEAAAADLLDAQLALEQGNMAEASTKFDEALRKDPGNKLVQYWKAQIDSRMGASGEAAKTLETLALEGSTKQLDSGLTLANAARSALANLSLQTGNVDDAIKRFEALRTGGDLGELARGDRWQLVSAYVARNQWPLARKEIASLLNDPKSPPSNAERIRAANFYRVNKETEAAVAQLDYVLRSEPNNPGAVLSRAYIFADEKKNAEAAALVRAAIAAPGKERPQAIFYLMLAALENATPPKEDAAKRAMTALDQGLIAQPDAIDLVREKYKLLLMTASAREAVAFVEENAKKDPSGQTTRLLAEVYRQQNDFDNAERVLTELTAKNPKDAALAIALVRVTSIQAVRAASRDERDRERAFNDRAATLIRQYRKTFPNELAIPEQECELAFRRGDVARALAVTEEIDKIARNSSVGPLLKAKLYLAQGRLRDVADAYKTALERNPGQPEVTLRLAQTRLKLGEPDEAIRLAKVVLDSDPNRMEALLLQARALAGSNGDSPDAGTRRDEAVTILRAALKKQPRFVEASHLIAEIQTGQGHRYAAIATLRDSLTAAPDDTVGLAMLVEMLASPARPGAPADPSSLKNAGEVATRFAAADTTGAMMLASAVGFHKAGQLTEARTWVEKAATKLDAPVLHLNHGDILLSLADQAKGDEAKTLVRQAVEQYDRVLAVQANSIEAINNKAWILHSYLGDSPKALELATGLLKRVDPSTLPGEFFDTLGAIQEAVGKPRDAEDSYSKGLRKTPDHPVLNYHMGKLMVGDKTRAQRARPYLEKAFAARGRLSPTMAAEVSLLMERVRAN